MKILILATAVLAAPAIPLPSPAQIHRMVDMLPQADANHDGFITRAEWRTFRAARFDRLDRNHDGYLNEADAPPFMARTTIQEMEAVLDTDHDGRVSRAEFIGGPAPVFDLIDTDHNGIIDPQELKKARESQ